MRGYDLMVNVPVICSAGIGSTVSGSSVSRSVNSVRLVNNFPIGRALRLPHRSLSVNGYSPHSIENPSQNHTTSPRPLFSYRHPDVCCRLVRRLRASSAEQAGHALYGALRVCGIIDPLRDATDFVNNPG